MVARAVCSVFEGDGVDLSVEMETGVGKTYTYIKTIHELYKKYGWMKYMIVVPSIAIRKGVHKCFKELEEHSSRITSERSVSLSTIRIVSGNLMCLRRIPAFT